MVKEEMVKRTAKSEGDLSDQEEGEAEITQRQDGTFRDQFNQSNLITEHRVEESKTVDIDNRIPRKPAKDFWADEAPQKEDDSRILYQDLQKNVAMANKGYQKSDIFKP